MHPMTTWQLAEQIGEQRRHRTTTRRTAARDRLLGAPAGAVTPAPPLHLRTRVSVWLGYRAIGLGCRLVRPAVVGGARLGGTPG